MVFNVYTALFDQFNIMESKYVVSEALTHALNDTLCLKRNMLSLM